ncbi:MAG: acetate/propionate family kinase [Alphaproteobacteria bacterium]|nr:acetate/propionate family kinase [Alphaproteobacteria bacterium]
MSGPILVVNAGSSSIKFAAYEAENAQTSNLRFRGQVEGIGSAPHMIAWDGRGLKIAERYWPNNEGVGHEEILGILTAWISEQIDRRPLSAAGHRIVHGGLQFPGPVLVDSNILHALDLLCPLAPLHQPHNIAAIRAIAAVAPSLPQVACFDTAFHRSQPEIARRFALPRELHDAGVRRYGFHGLSYEYIASVLRTRAPRLAAGRVIVAHLGAGASLCAMLDGKSVDTTMGFTALDGLPMGTRCGALDPGVVLYLLRDRGMNAATIETLLYNRSGLLGVSGLSGDMRELLAATDKHAKEAIELFVYRICREIGALTATLGGLDGLVFTGGIGEHSSEIRSRVCEASRWLGCQVDPVANQSGAECISTPESDISVWVVATNEEKTIVRQTIDVLEAGAAAVRTHSRGRMA